MRILRTFLVVSLILVPIQLHAQAPPGARTHDGFFLRFLAGGGPGRLVIDNVMGNEVKFTSIAGGAFHFQIGGAVKENLILFGDVGGFALTDPDVESGGSTESGANLDITASGFGGGLSYYIMPANIFLSASVLASTNALTYQSENYESELGPSFLVSVGKEWWVGNSWGLGVAVLLELGFTRDQRDPTTSAQPDMTTRMFGVAFSATLN
jgi:hypothetical protein